jgi:hypothetical protein
VEERNMTPEHAAALSLVQSSLGRSRRGQMVLATIVAGLAWLCTLGIREDATFGRTLMTYGVIVFFGLMAVLLFWVALFKNSPTSSPLVVALRQNPDHVVWIFQQDVKVDVDGIPAPVRDANVISRLRDGSTVAMTVAKGDAPALLAALAMLAPRAATGFTTEREEQFKKDPGSLSGAGPA